MEHDLPADPSDPSESRATGSKKKRKKKGGKGSRQKRLRNHVRGRFAAGKWISMLQCQSFFLVRAADAQGVVWAEEPEEEQCHEEPGPEPWLHGFGFILGVINFIFNN